MTNILMIVAIILGPILAVQAQKRIEFLNQRKESKLSRGGRSLGSDLIIEFQLKKVSA